MTIYFYDEEAARLAGYDPLLDDPLPARGWDAHSIEACRVHEIQRISRRIAAFRRSRTPWPKKVL